MKPPGRGPKVTKVNADGTKSRATAADIIKDFLLKDIGGVLRPPRLRWSWFLLSATLCKTQSLLDLVFDATSKSWLTSWPNPKNRSMMRASV
jgi:hypothetical protein